MNSKDTHKIPDHVLNELSSEGPLSAAEQKNLEFILGTAARKTYPSTNADAAWNKFLSSTGNHLKVVKKPQRFAMFRWVAAAVIVLTAGIAVWQYADYRANTYSDSFSSAETAETHDLPDGSTVRLNKNTKLEITSINNRKRLIKLEYGEIFISVKQNNTPFQVITPKGSIYVMGTEFNIRAVKGEPFTLYLKKGKIRFQSDNVQTDLEPGQVISEESNGDFVLNTIKDNRYSAWTDGKLVFENALLSEVVKGLEALYHVGFEYDQNLNSEHITVTFDNLSAEQAAELLGRTLNSKVTIK